MTNYEDPNDLLMGGGGARAAKFERPGDAVTGLVTAIDARQATKIGTTTPAFWDDGNKRMVAIITLQTDEAEDQDDDGLRAVWAPIPSQIRTMIAEAVRKVGESQIEKGGRLTVTFERTEKATKIGFNPQKIYSVRYAAPDHSAIIMDAESPQKEGTPISNDGEFFSWAWQAHRVSKAMALKHETVSAALGDHDYTAAQEALARLAEPF